MMKKINPLRLLSHGSEESSLTTWDSVAKTPYFLEQLVFCGDNERLWLIKARSGLGWFGENAISPANLALILNRPRRFEIRADNGRFGERVYLSRRAGHEKNRPLGGSRIS
jgi:hypothetical protein